jgi:hypothetical protein
MVGSVNVKKGYWGATGQKSSISKQSERKHRFVNSLQDVSDMHKFTSV